MKISKLIPIIMLFSIVKVTGDPSKVEDFDSQKRTVRDMLEIVMIQLRDEQSKSVVFPDGNFKLCGPEDDKKPAVPGQPFKAHGHLEVLANDELLILKLQQWLNEAKPTWVYIHLDVDLPSKFFFKVEEQLSTRGILYIVSKVDHNIENTIRLEVMPGYPEFPKTEEP